MTRTSAITQPTSSTVPSTPLEALVRHVRGWATSPEGVAQPAAILWPDPSELWRPAIALIRAAMPEFLELGSYAPELRRGPAVWIRCVVDGSIPLPSGGAEPNRPVVIYLPGVQRDDLRAGDDCPPHLRPLVELLYRGRDWRQSNGQEWTPMAFMRSTATLNLDIAGDRLTTEALRRALHELLRTPLSHLRGRRLEADDLDGLLSTDVPRDLLRWIADSEATRAAMAANWASFESLVRQRYTFDLARSGPIAAAERVCSGEGTWNEVWTRFADAPEAFPGVVDTMAKAHCPQPLIADRTRWVQFNDEAEDTVRAELRRLPRMAHADACAAVVALESAHGQRRSSVWARLRRTPMARVLEPLARLASVARSPLGGGKPDDFVAPYEESAWLADAAMWEALALSQSADESIVAAAIHALAEPWLTTSAVAFQSALARTESLGAHEPTVEASEGACLLFADGLRYDLGRRLAQRLEARGLAVSIAHRWAALPSVTHTGKPAVSPVAASLHGAQIDAEFCPQVAETGKRAEAAALRSLIATQGYQILDATELASLSAPGEAAAGCYPRSATSRGWCEVGDIDDLGHTLDVQLACHIDEQLGRLADRIEALLRAGWTAVRVVTDHGWLFLPGGLPRVDLPRHLTASRWCRGAMPSGTLPAGVVGVLWRWNPAATVATPPGVACFNAAPTYAHGGVSVQECLLPDLLVTASGPAAPSASIAAIAWRKMRCLIEVRGTLAGVRAEIRLGGANGPPATPTPKVPESDGVVSFVVEDDHESAELVVVLLDAAGTVIAQRTTRVGESS